MQPLDEVEVCKQRLRNHEDVEQTLLILQALLPEADTAANAYDVNQPSTLTDIFQHVLADVLFRKANKESSDYSHIAPHFKFMKFVLENASGPLMQEQVSFDVEQLQQIFQHCFLDSTDEREQFLTLDVFHSFWNKSGRSWEEDDINNLQMFYISYFQQLMQQYQKQQNYKMICFIFSCFAAYYRRTVQRDLESCLSAFELDIAKMKQTFVEELEQTDLTANPLKVETLVSALHNIQQSMDAKAATRSRVPLIKAQSATDQFKAALMTIFETFASNTDDTMCVNDMRRYIISMGAGPNSASRNRVQAIFRQNTDCLDTTRMSKNGLIRFYIRASMDRPEHVWNDLNIFGYASNLELLTSEQKTQTDQEAMYDQRVTKMVQKLLTATKEQTSALDEELVDVEDLRQTLIKLPKSRYDTDFEFHVEKALQRLEQPLEELLKIGDNTVDADKRTAMQTVRRLHCVCSNSSDEWKKRFLDKNGMGHLIRMLGFFAVDGMDGNTQAMQLGTAITMKLIYELNKVYTKEMIPRALFMNSIQDGHLLEVLSEFVSNEKSTKRILLFLICNDAKLGEAVANNLFIATEVVQVYAEPLIVRFVKECDTPKEIPIDIITLLLHFFYCVSKPTAKEATV